MIITVKMLFDMPQIKKLEALQYCVKALPTLGYAEEDIIYNMMSATERATGTRTFTTLDQIIHSDEVYRAAFIHQDKIDAALLSGELNLPLTLQP